MLVFSKSHGTHTRVMNQFIASLPVEARVAIEPDFDPVPLQMGEVLHRVGGPVDYVYFPISGLVSVVITMGSGQTAATSIIGREGMVCSAIVLDVNRALDQATVELPGTAIRIHSRAFIAAYRKCEPLRRMLNRYHGLMLAEARQSVACNALHDVQHRLVSLAGRGAGSYRQ